MRKVIIGEPITKAKNAKLKTPADANHGRSLLTLKPHAGKTNFKIMPYQRLKIKD